MSFKRTPFDSVGAQSAVKRFQYVRSELHCGLPGKKYDHFSLFISLHLFLFIHLLFFFISSAVLCFSFRRMCIESLPVTCFFTCLHMLFDFPAHLVVCSIVDLSNDR